MAEITSSKLAELWKECYGEDLAEKYPDFCEKLQKLENEPDTTRPLTGSAFGCPHCQPFNPETVHAYGKEYDFSTPNPDAMTKMDFFLQDSEVKDHWDRDASRLYSGTEGWQGVFRDDNDSFCLAWRQAKQYCEKLGASWEEIVKY